MVAKNGQAPKPKLDVAQWDELSGDLGKLSRRLLFRGGSIGWRYQGRRGGAIRMGKMKKIRMPEKGGDKRGAAARGLVMGVVVVCRGIPKYGLV